MQDISRTTTVAVTGLFIYLSTAGIYNGISLQHSTQQLHNLRGFTYLLI